MTVDDGLFKQFPYDIIFGIHNIPGFKEDHFNFKADALMASSDTIMQNEIITKSKINSAFIFKTPSPSKIKKTKPQR